MLRKVAASPKMAAGNDPAFHMLEEYVQAQQANSGAYLNCGSGHVALAAIRAGATDIWCSDRRFPYVISARELLGAHGSNPQRVLHAHGALGFPVDAHAVLATIRIPTDRIGVQQLIHDAFRLLDDGGVCALAGGNGEGIKTAVRVLEWAFGNVSIEMNHSGHRLAVARKHSACMPSQVAENQWLDPDTFRALNVNVRGSDITIFTRPGVFSWEHLDEATAILVDVMEVHAGESVLEIGCGAGLPGISAALSGASRVLMVDSDSEAIRCVRRTITFHALGNAEVRASDVSSSVGNELFDVVVSNPPFHHGKSVDLVTPRRFIRESWEHLVPGGRLFIVANRTLPYERVIEEQFGHVRVVHDGRRFKVLGATR